MEFDLSALPLPQEEKAKPYGVRPNEIWSTKENKEQIVIFRNALNNFQIFLFRLQIAKYVCVRYWVVLPKRAAWLKLLVLVPPLILLFSSLMFRVGVFAARRSCPHAAFGFGVASAVSLVRLLGFCVFSVLALLQVLAGATLAAQSV